MLLPEKRVLIAPDVCKDEPADVCRSRNLGALILCVIRPDVCNEMFHEVDVFVVFFAGKVTCHW